MKLVSKVLTLLLLIFCSTIAAQLLDLSSVDADIQKVKTTIGFVIPAKELDVNLTSMNGVKSGTRKVKVFYGIPYAEPPVGELRFRPPKPKAAWKSTQVLNATTKSVCPQVPAMLPVDQMTEDCLHLNAYVPISESKKLLPVMVWIHGGGLIFGSANQDYFNSEYLAANEQVIVFLINYRVGFTGAFSTDDKVMKGNYLFFDHQLAMKWIKENAANFGGDPEKITLFGESGGAWAVSYHLVNEESKNSSILSDTASFRRFSEEFARNSSAQCAACANADYQCLLECMQQKNSTEIIQLANDFFMGSMPHYFTVNVIVDGDFIKVHPSLLPKTAYSSDKEVLLGVNENEGGLFLYGNLMRDPEADKDNPAITTINSAFKTIVNHQPPKSQFTESQLKSLEILRTPWEDAENAVLTAKAASRMIGQWMFVTSANQEADLYVANNAKVFYYEFNYAPGFAPALNAVMPEWVGATHGDEVGFVFGNYPKHTLEERKLSRLMMRHWANFARKGDPNDATVPNWPAMRKVEKDYIFYAAGDGKSKARTGGVQRRDCAIFDKLMPEMGSALKAAKSAGTTTEAGASEWSLMSAMAGAMLVLVLLVVGKRMVL